MFLEKVQKALQQVASRDVGPVQRERAIADLGLDSVSMAEMLVLLEDELDLSLEQSDVEKVKTFGDLEELVLRLRAPQQAGS